MTESQADQIAERIANNLERRIDELCPMPAAPIVCPKCRGEGYWLENGDRDLQFCRACEAGKIRRRRQAVLNRMVHGSYARSRRRQDP